MALGAGLAARGLRPDAGREVGRDEGPWHLAMSMPCDLSPAVMPAAAPSTRTTIATIVTGRVASVRSRCRASRRCSRRRVFCQLSGGLPVTDMLASAPAGRA